MIRWARLYHERLLRGVAAPKVLSCRRGLHCPRGILDSNGFGCALPAWQLPNWSLRLKIVLLLIGFPIAVVLACARQ